MSRPSISMVEDAKKSDANLQHVVALLALVALAFEALMVRLFVPKEILMKVDLFEKKHSHAPGEILICRPSVLGGRFTTYFCIIAVAVVGLVFRFGQKNPEGWSPSPN